MYLIRNNAGDVEKALEMFEAAIAMYPNRYRSNAGAAAAADALGNDIKASLYYGNVREVLSLPWSLLYSVRTLWVCVVVTNDIYLIYVCM